MVLPKHSSLLECDAVTFSTFRAILVPLALWSLKTFDIFVSTKCVLGGVGEFWGAADRQPTPFGTHLLLSDVGEHFTKILLILLSLQIIMYRLLILPEKPIWTSTTNLLEIATLCIVVFIGAHAII